MLQKKTLIFSKFIDAHPYVEEHFLSCYLVYYQLTVLQNNRGHIFSIMQTEQIILPHIIFPCADSQNLCVILQEPLDAQHQNQLREELRKYYSEAHVVFYLCKQKFLHQINFCLTIKHYLEEKELHENLIISLISLAVLYNVSDIHITLQEKVGKIALRIEGNLLHFMDFNELLFYKIAQKIKLLCHLDITEKRLPQDGHFSIDGLFDTHSFKTLYQCVKDDFAISLSQQHCDIRISCFPALENESIVLRIPHYSQKFLSLDSLNLQPHIRESLKKHLLAKSGLILVSGPTGSGKSTLLYNCLRFLNDSTKKIITIEDPIEQNIAGITQCQVNEELNFSLALKHILRQDPDIIMIGEIRDSATMESALRATLTGHLVLASIHSHDCQSSIARLKDLGAKQYLLESTLSCIISQRLLKTFCPQCKIQDKAIALGCPHCYYQGFGKRILIQEILDSKMIQDFLRLESLSQESLSKFLSLKQQANNLFEQGIIPYEESLL
ncbi:general secretion pathway protein GspE [Helicobacter aurati]|uniref:General secretion pathway protein GspE n=2 Tax=Helicobacter aurati TaxID=137778 RepID=A0A3D8J7A3_9HELI|nr:general secretion pathway protein GspE [Helicobacter aurati]